MSKIFPYAGEKIPKLLKISPTEFFLKKRRISVLHLKMTNDCGNHAGRKFQTIFFFIKLKKSCMTTRKKFNKTKMLKRKISVAFNETGFSTVYFY